MNFIGAIPCTVYICCPDSLSLRSSSRHVQFSVSLKSSGPQSENSTMFFFNSATRSHTVGIRSGFNDIRSGNGWWVGCGAWRCGRSWRDCVRVEV